MTREESPAKHQSSSAPPHVHGHLATRRAAFERPQPQPRPQQLLPSSPSSSSMTHTHKSSKSATGRRFPLPQNSSLATSLPSTPSATHALYPTSQHQHPTRPVLLQLHTQQTLWPRVFPETPSSMMATPSAKCTAPPSRTVGISGSAVASPLSCAIALATNLRSWLIGFVFCHQCLDPVLYSVSRYLIL